MNDLTHTQIDHLFAKKIPGWTCIHDSSDRNDLADVLRWLTPEQWASVIEALRMRWDTSTTECPGHGWVWWTHTCDPSIIARAVAEVVR